MAVFRFVFAPSNSKRKNKVPSTKKRDEQINPLFNFFKTKDDRWICLSPRAGGDYDLPKVVRAIGKEEWLENDKFNTNQGRRENANEFVNEMDKEEATSSPKVNASSAFPIDPIISQPITQKGKASHTCSKDLSARDPINQNTISEVAYGFGDRLRASDVNAPAKALTAIPAKISVKELPRGPANNRRSNTAKVAKENAAIGRPIQT